MRYLHQSILIGLGLLSSSFGYAYTLDIYADALYWQASESIDWALTNSNISSTIQPNQTISYKTIAFDYRPGFRVGIGIQADSWTTRLIYTRYNTQTSASTNGNVISTFMPSKFNSKFYQSGNVSFSINFNMFDLDLYKQIKVYDTLVFNPVVGLKTGWINQQVNTQYKNPILVPPNNYNPNNVTEKVRNNFSGIGPKIGINSQWYFYQKNNFQCSIVGDFSAAYLWGSWGIRDKLYQDNAGVIGSVNVGNRDFGAFEVQGIIGVGVDYKNSSLKVGYEISDWFNQYQVFDNGSGTHTNDLVLQGLTVAFNYNVRV
jgi:hypothetical protein